MLHLPPPYIAQAEVHSFSPMQFNLKTAVLEHSESSFEAFLWLAQWGLEPPLMTTCKDEVLSISFLITSLISLNNLSSEEKGKIFVYIVENETKLKQEFSRLQSDPLIIAIQSGNAALCELILNERGGLNDIDRHYSLIKLLIYWMEFHKESASIKILKLLKSHGAIVQEKFLIDVLNLASAGFIAEMLQGQNIVWSEELALICLQKIQCRKEELIWQALKEAGWPFALLSDKDNKGILTCAIEERNLKGVQWLLRQDAIKIQDRDIQAARECGDLEILECFIPPEKIVQELLDERASLPNQLQSYFLFSRLEKVQQYIFLLENETIRRALPELNLTVNATLCQTALIRRYTQRHEIFSLGEAYEIDLKLYVQKQMEFGRNFHEAVLRKLHDWKQGQRDLLTTITDFAKARHQMATTRLEKAPDAYLEFRFNDTESTRLFYTFLGAPFQDRTRYSFAIPWIKKVLHQQNSQELEKQEKEYSYRLFYKDPQTLKNYPLTLVSLDKRHWIHTKDEVASELWPILQQMHEDLLARPIDIQDPFQVQEFQNKVAEAYWLGCQIMISSRGNSQYFLMWLSCMLQFHGFAPLLTKRETPQPDCIALSLPLSDFIAAFASLYENPLFAEGRLQTKVTFPRVDIHN